MDISGVDVDFLSDEEILELCGDIVDKNTDEIFILKNVDINNLSDDKVQNIYDDMIYGSQVSNTANKVIPLTDQQVLDLNYDTVDMDNSEIALIKGQNIDIDNLSDDEILALYSDFIDTNNSPIIAGSSKEISDCYLSYAYFVTNYYYYTYGPFRTVVCLQYQGKYTDTTYYIQYPLIKLYDTSDPEGFYNNVAFGYTYVQWIEENIDSCKVNFNPYSNPYNVAAGSYVWSYCYLLCSTGSGYTNFGVSAHICRSSTTK